MKMTFSNTILPITSFKKESYDTIHKKGEVYTCATKKGEVDYLHKHQSSEKKEKLLVSKAASTSL